MSYYIDIVIEIDGRTSKCYRDQIPSLKVDLPSNETKMVEFSNTNPTQKKKKGSFLRWSREWHLWWACMTCNRRLGPGCRIKHNEKSYNNRLQSRPEGDEARVERTDGILILWRKIHHSRIQNLTWQGKLHTCWHVSLWDMYLKNILSSRGFDTFTLARRSRLDLNIQTLLSILSLLRPALQHGQL